MNDHSFISTLFSAVSSAFVPPLLRFPAEQMHVFWEIALDK
jgi:hypothetical protein